MAYGLLALRLIIGLTMAAHGAQKLFGAFGGGGPRGTGQFLGSLGFRGGALTASLLGLAELGGGLLFATGLLTPLGAVLIMVVMLTALAVVHWPKGFFITEGGYEFVLAIATVAFAVTAIGPGRYSLDAAVGWASSITGIWWAVGVVAVASFCALVASTVGRWQPTERGVYTMDDVDGGRRDERETARA